MKLHQYLTGMAILLLPGLTRTYAQDSTRQLKAVTISRKKPLIEKKADRIVFNAAGNINAAGADVWELLGKIPGLKMGDNGISMAGKGTVSIMVNDRLVKLSSDELVRYLKSFSANDIQKVEVFTHPPARFDAEGNAGLINIITKKSSQAGYSGSVQGTYKRNNFDNAGLGGNINYNGGRWLLFANANLYNNHILEGFETDVYYPSYAWMLSDTGNYKTQGFTATAGAEYRTGSRSSIGFSYTGGRDNTTGSDHVYNPYQSGPRPDSILRTYAVYHPVASNQALNLHYVTALDTTGKKLSVDADYFNYYRTDKSDFESNSHNSHGQQTPWGKALYHNTAKQAIDIYTLRADLELPTSFARFAVGAKASFINNYSNAFYYRKNGGGTGFDSTKSNEFTYRENTQALYVSADKEVGRWKVQAGLRGELTQTRGYSHMLRQTDTRTYFKLFPSLLLTYEASNDHSYSLAFNKRINRPSFWNLNPYKSLTTDYSYFQGDPRLQPEYSTNTELSHNFRGWLKTSAWFNVVNNGFDNITIASEDVQLIYRTPINFITSYRYGLTATVTLHPLPWLETINTGNFYRTDARSALPQINNIALFSGYLSTSNTITFNAAKTITGAVNGWYQFAEVDHIGKSDAYYRLDLGLSVLALQKKLAITFNVNDLLRSSAPTVYTTVNNIPQRYVNFQVYRSASVTLTYRFGNNAVKASGHSSGNTEERSRL